MKAIPTEQYAFKIILSYGEYDIKAQIMRRRLKWEREEKIFLKILKKSLTTIYYLLKFMVHRELPCIRVGAILYGCPWYIIIWKLPYTKTQKWLQIGDMILLENIAPVGLKNLFN